jgi:aryl-alcohol dehydrogenase-like predicted oxidoreductase
MCQISGGHGRINPKIAIESMFQYVDAGFTTWDLANHYGPAEDLIGEFRRQLITTRGEEAVNNIQAFTKWVPRPEKMTKNIVEENHSWEYRDSNYLYALKYMAKLQTEGTIQHLALTNFDTEHL